MDSDVDLDFLERLVAHESPTGDVVRNTTLARMLAAELDALGAAVERIEAPGWGEHVRARIAGADDGAAPVLLLGHFDTVHQVGTFDPVFRVRDGRAEGPGVFDMKSGIVVMIEALRDLSARGVTPRRPVELLLTCDEELGSISSRPLIEEAGGRAHTALVLEPSLPGGAAKTARKGVANYRIRAIGRAAHAGVDPEKGVSAVIELARQVLDIAALADLARGTTINAGVIRGGTASNVVAAAAEAEIDVRFATAAEAERVDAAVRALEALTAGAKLEIEDMGMRPPLERTDAIRALYGQAKDIAAAQGWELPEGSTGGASDGSYVAALGTPTLDGLGPDGGGAHAVDEHILIDELPRRVALIAGLLETL